VLAGLAVAGLAVAAEGCASNSSGGTSPAPTVASAGSPPILTSTGKAVPAPLEELEAQSEDIIDIVPGGAWDDIAADVQKVDDAWGQYQAEAADDGAPATISDGIAASIAALDLAAGAKQPTETMQAANDLSAGVVELYGLYEIGRPVGIGRLDVIGRQIVFDADAKDKAGVEAQLGKARSEWSVIEADLAGRDGQEVADRTNGLLDALAEQAAAGDFGAVATDARDFLEVVDAMEQLY
jgi:hypothetical protein